MDKNTLDKILDAAINKPNAWREPWTKLSEIRRYYSRELLKARKKRALDNALDYYPLFLLARLRELLKDDDNRYVLSKLCLEISDKPTSDLYIKHIFDDESDAKKDFEIIGSIAQWALVGIIEVTAPNATNANLYRLQVNKISNKSKVMPKYVNNLIILDCLLASLNSDSTKNHTTQISMRTVALNLKSAERDSIKELLLFSELTALSNIVAQYSQLNEELVYLKEKQKERLVEIETRVHTKVIELAGFMIAVFSIIGINIVSMSNNRDLTWPHLIKINIALIVTMVALFGLMYLITKRGASHKY